MWYSGLWPLWAVLLASIIGIAVLSWTKPRWQWPYTAIFSLSLVITVFYVGWRIDQTLDFDTILDALASTLLLSAELLGIIQFIIFGLFMFQHYRRPQPQWPADRPLPTVDLYIATYNESVSVLEKNLAACHAIQYPKELLAVYICDDGNRPEIHALADKWEARYLARPTHEHAKAGNLNYAMAHSTGQLLLTMDADMIPKPDIVNRMIGYFLDPQMGFVQAPQVFYNPDPFQHNLPFGHVRNNDQDYFMREMLPRRDRLHAIMYIGSNAMFSRKALEKIGGFITGSITEDLATGLVLQAEKFHSAYCDAVVATGLSPESFAEMVNQRVRWCRGNIQVFKQNNILTPRGLTLWQRTAYISGTLYWYFGVQKMVFVISPMLFLLFGIISLHTTIGALAIMWIPYFLSQILTFKRLSARKSNVWWSHVQELSLMPFMAFAAIAETFNISMKGFRVTNKGMVTQKAYVTRYFWVLAGFAALSMFAFLYGLSMWAADTSVIARNSLEISLAWDGFNMAGLIFATIGAYERPRPRAHERHVIQMPARLALRDHTVYAAELRDISEGGFRIAGIEQPAGAIFQTGTLTIQGRALPVKITAIRRGKGEGPHDWVGEFTPMSQEEYEHLIRVVFGAPESGDCPSLGTVFRRSQDPRVVSLPSQQSVEQAEKARTGGLAK